MDLLKKEKKVPKQFGFRYHGRGGRDYIITKTKLKIRPLRKLISLTILQIT